MKESIKFSRGIGTMLVSGIPIVTACKIYLKGCKNKKIKNIIETILKDLEDGNDISYSLKKYPTNFPVTYIAIIQIGEITGELGKYFIKGGDILEKNYENKKNLKRVLLYPKILLIVTGIVIVILFLWIIPAFYELIEDKEQIPIFTQIIFKIGLFFQSIKFQMIIFLAIIIALIKILIKNRYILIIPVLGNIEKIKFSIRFSKIMAALLSNGITIKESLTFVVEGEKNREFQRKVLMIKRGLDKGKDLTTLITFSKVFSEVDISLIKAGEESGKLPYVFEKISELKESELEDFIKTITILAEPVIIIFMGIILGSIVAGVYLPILDMIEKNI
jgi:type IV pilus assembly protein PilC